MIDLVKVLLAFAVILFLLRKKIDIGIAMSCGALAMILIYTVPFPKVFNLIYSVITNIKVLEIILTIYLIMVLENVMRKTGHLDRMSKSVTNFVGDKRIAMSVMPALIGILPSPGGARFSAPMVESICNNTQYNNSHKSFINYWFRHPLEYISPLYPGILLAAALLNLPVNRLIIYMLPFPLIMILLGGLIAFWGTGPLQKREKNASAIRMMMESIWPIIGIAATVLLGLPVYLSLLLVLLVLFISEKYKLSEIIASLRQSFSFQKVFLLFWGIYFFKESLEISGAINGITLFLSQFPIDIVLFLLPFIVGLLTGVTVAFVGVTFPFLISLYGGRPELGAFVFAFAAGYNGVLLSPVHLCLLMTRDYFNATMGGIYRILIIPSMLMILFAFLYYLLLINM